MMLLLFTIFLLTACTEQESIEVIVIVDDMQYGEMQEGLGTYEIGETIGVVTNKVPADMMPQHNEESNFFDEGVAIFSVKNEENVIALVDHLNSKEYIMKKVATNE